MKRKFVLLMVLLMACAGTSQAWNTATDWSETNPDPATPWTYGSLTEIDGSGSFITYDAFISHGTQYNLWCKAYTPEQPHVGKSYQTTIYEDDGMYLPAGMTYAHPFGPDDDPEGKTWAVYRFTAPQDGLYQIDAEFFGLNHADPAGAESFTTTDVHVLLNSGTSSIYDGYVSGFYNYGGQCTVDDTFGTSPYQSFSGTISLLANETIEFVIGSGDDHYWYDITGVNATVNLIPEPATLTLLGLSSLMLLRRRKI